MLRTNLPRGLAGGRRSVSGLRRLVLPALLATTAITLGACGSSSSTSSSSTAAASTSASGASTSASGGASSLAGKRVTVVTAPDSANPWVAVFNERVKKELSAAGANVTITGVLDPAGQVQYLNQAVAEKPDLIMIDALDSKAVAPSIAKAKAQKTPFLNVDGPADPSVAAGLNQVLSDHLALGEFAAENIVEGLEKEGKTSGNIGVITGTASQSITQERMQGFKKVLAKHPGFKIVFEQDANWEPAKAGEIATQMFAKYGKEGLQAAYGMADYLAVPILTAAKQAGVSLGLAKKGLIVTGGNCFKVGINAIEKGEMFATATEDPGTLGEYASAYATKLLSGQQVPTIELVKEARVDPATLKQYTAQCTKA